MNNPKTQYRKQIEQERCNELKRFVIINSGTPFAFIKGAEDPLLTIKNIDVSFVRNGLC